MSEFGFPWHRVVRWALLEPASPYHTVPRRTRVTPPVPTPTEIEGHLEFGEVGSPHEF